MGHRANFVIIRDGRASAYYDQWAALGSAYLVADGPAAARAAVEVMETTTELLDWAFAEGGFLTDFDEQKLIVFGYPEPLDDFEELSEFAGAEGMPDTALSQSFDGGAETFLRYIAPRWSGWSLVWDERGVDAFAEHLASRGIVEITAQPASHPAGQAVFRVQA